jgi:hypothetical protein
MCVDLGMARNSTEADFHFVPQKVRFPFLECRNQVFCEAPTKTANGKLGITSHINNRPSGIHISALVSPHTHLELFLDFTQTHVDFVGTGVGLPFSSNKTSSYFFAKIIFRSTTYHFFTKLCTLKRDSAPPGHEHEFRALSCSCGSRIRHN